MPFWQHLSTNAVFVAFLATFAEPGNHRVNEWLVRKTYVPPSSRKGYIPDFDVIQMVTAINTQERGVKQLQCTCQYSDVYGMPCIHSIVVASSFRPNWTYITHNDVSIRWWKAYYLFSLPDTIIPDKVKQQQIKQVFKTLKKQWDCWYTCKGICIYTTKDSWRTNSFRIWSVASRCEMYELPGLKQSYRLWSVQL